MLFLMLDDLDRRDFTARNDDLNANIAGETDAVAVVNAVRDFRQVESFEGFDSYNVRSGAFRIALHLFDGSVGRRLDG